MTSRIATFIGYVVVPVAGILFFGWDWRAVIFLYWLENVTVGARNVISMLRTERVVDPAAPSRLSLNGRPITASSSRVGLVLFFIAHYGIFTTVHGVFVMIIVFAGGFGPCGSGRSTPEPFEPGSVLLVWGVASAVQIIGELLAPRSSIPPVSALFLAPYGRVLALHVTILGGVWLIAALDWPPAAAILLVALHFLTDLWSLRPRRRSRQSRGANVYFGDGG